MNKSAKYPGYRWMILLVACLGYAGSQMDMIGMAPLLPTIAGNLKIGLGMATNLMSVFLFSSSLALIGGGFLCDRFGILFVITLGLSFASIPAILMPWIGTSYTWVLAARFVQGLSLGFVMCAMAPIVAIWFPPEEKGLASGVMGASISLGSALGVLAAPAVFVRVGSWQQMCAWLSIVGWLALAIGLAMILRPAPTQHYEHIVDSAANAGGNMFKDVLLSSFTWIGILTTFFAAWCLQTLYNLAPSYFAAGKPIGTGFGPMLSGKLMLSVMIAGMIAPVIGGLLQDKIFHGNPKPVMLIGFSLCCLFIFPIQFATVYGSIPVLVCFLFLAGAGIQLVYPGIVVLVSKSYPVHIVGKMLGVWMGLGALGGAAGLFAGGLSVGALGNYNGAITLMALGGMLGFIFICVLSRLKIQTE